MALVKLLMCFNVLHLILAQEMKPQVECSRELMKVMVPMGTHRKMTYLDQMKDYSPCKPVMNDNLATYNLNLSDPYKCGVTRVLNKMTGKKTFYHKIVIEDKSGGHETVTVGCSVMPKHISKRDVEPLPLDFQEPEVVPITRVEEWHAPEPHLGVLVRQNGKKVSGEIAVTPGTPLSMEIFLDNSSAPVYGIFVNYMLVSDTGVQSESIILNGCSLDPYLFDNFLTEDGDVLKAKFKAFKFPDTTYIQFKGTVTVCLNNCTAVQCSNGVKGYGRRRRSIENGGANLFEVSVTTFIKVEPTDDLPPFKITELHEKNLGVANQMLDSNPSPATVFERKDNNFVLLKPTPAANQAVKITNLPLLGVILLISKWII